MHSKEKGISNLMVRVQNRKSIGKLLYSEGPLTKQIIASKLKLSLPTVNLLLQQLKDEGLVTEQTSEVSTGGRKPQLLCFNYNAKVSVGIEISQNHNRLVITNLKNQILAEKQEYQHFENNYEYWNGLKDRVSELLIKNNINSSKVLGVGIAIPGTVIHSRNVVEFAPTLNLKNLSYSGFESIFHIPVIVENEANASGFAEMWSRKIVGCAAYISVTKGIGGAIIINNNVFVGNSCRSGEFGHMTLIPNGADCACGRKGCFEAYCSTKELTKHSNGDIDEFFKRLKKGDETLLKIWDTYLDYLATGISNIHIALDIKVILGGDLVQYLRDDYEKLYQKVRERVLYEESDQLFTLSTIDKNAAATGAALLLITKFLDE